MCPIDAILLRALKMSWTPFECIYSFQLLCAKRFFYKEFDISFGRFTLFYESWRWRWPMRCTLVSSIRTSFQSVLALLIWVLRRCTGPAQMTVRIRFVFQIGWLILKGVLNMFTESGLFNCLSFSGTATVVCVWGKYRETLSHFASSIPFPFPGIPGWTRRWTKCLPGYSLSARAVNPCQNKWKLCVE